MKHAFHIFVAVLFCAQVQVAPGALAAPQADDDYDEAQAYVAFDALLREEEAAEYAAIVAELLEAIGVRYAFNGVQMQYYEEHVARLEAANPGKGADIRKVMAEEVKRINAEEWAAFVKKMAGVYGRYFSFEEVYELVLYHRSQVAAKLRQADKTISKERSELAGPALRRADQRLVSEAAARLQKQGIRIPPEGF